MRIHVTSRHARLTPTLRRSIEERLAAATRLAPVGEAHVILDVQKSRHVAEIIAHAAGREIVVREEASDVRTAVDVALERLGTRLKRVKDRRTTRRLHDGTRPNGDEVAGAVRSAARVALRGGEPQVKKARGAEAMPMSVDEAAERLLSDGGDWLAFVNAETGRVNVLQRRKDGHLGLVAPREAARRARVRS